MTCICTCFCVPPLRKKTSNPAERVENDKWRPSDSNFFFGRVECNHCLRYLRPSAEQNRSRERERERERPPEALWELRERSGWEGGRFLPARNEILGVFCVLLNLLSNRGRPSSFLHASCASYIAKAITSMQNNHILLIALDSVQIVQFCNHMISVQLPRHSSMFTHLVPVMPQNLIRIMKTHN